MELFLEYSGWLYTKLYQNSLFFLDLWSIVHCWSGFMLFILFVSLKFTRPVVSVFIFLILYEFVEIIITWLALGIFRPETIKDQFTDIVVGLLGVSIGWLILRNVRLEIKHHRKLINVFLAVLASITYAFLWVGFYGYEYSIEMYNFNGINWTAFGFWTVGTFIMLRVFELSRVEGIWRKFAIIWLGYFVSLLVVEFFGYNIWQLHEISRTETKPLMFGLIHGTPILHIFYLISPFFTIPLYLLLKKITYNSVQNYHAQYKTKTKSALQKPGWCFERRTNYRYD